MTAVDTALEARAAAGRPIQVAIVGAGVNARSVALQLLTPPPGIRLAAICNRTLDHAARAFAEGGVPGVRTVSSGEALDQAIGQGAYAITDDPAVVCESGRIDLVLEATGTVDHAAGVLAQAHRRRKARHPAQRRARLDCWGRSLVPARRRPE